MLSESELAEVEELLAASTLLSLDARNASPGASGRAAIAIGDVASGWNAGCAKTGVEVATAKLSPNIHGDGLAMKHFGISVLFKINDLRAARGKNISQRTLYAGISLFRYLLKDAIAKAQVVQRDSIGTGDTAVTTSAPQGEYTAIMVDHAFY